MYLCLWLSLASDSDTDTDTGTRYDVHNLHPSSHVSVDSSARYEVRWCDVMLRSCSFDPPILIACSFLDLITRIYSGGIEIGDDRWQPET